MSRKWQAATESVLNEDIVVPKDMNVSELEVCRDQVGMRTVVNESLDVQSRADKVGLTFEQNEIS